MCVENSLTRLHAPVRCVYRRYRPHCTRGLTRSRIHKYTKPTLAHGRRRRIINTQTTRQSRSAGANFPCLPNVDLFDFAERKRLLNVYACAVYTFVSERYIVHACRSPRRMTLWTGNRPHTQLLYNAHAINSGRRARADIRRSSCIMYACLDCT